MRKSTALKAALVITALALIVINVSDAMTRILMSAGSGLVTYLLLSADCIKKHKQQPEPKPAEVIPIDEKGSLSFDEALYTLPECLNSSKHLITGEELLGLPQETKDQLYLKAHCAPYWVDYGFGSCWDSVNGLVTTEPTEKHFALFMNTEV